jgi:hypothetical protein
MRCSVEAGMLAARDVELARETVRDLRAQGQAERAQAVEAVLAAALATQDAAQPANPPEYVTFPQAARALGTETRTIRRWIAQGLLPTAEINGRPAVRLQTIFDFLASSRVNEPTAQPPTPAELAAARRRDRFVLGGLPKDKLARLESLHEKIEACERLSRAECAELTALERELIDLAGDRLKAWTATAQSRAR